MCGKSAPCDSYQQVNPVLQVVAKEAYRQREFLPTAPQIITRREVIDDKSFCEVWFMTEGCSHAKKGGCTMCNYGKGHAVQHADILRKLSAEFDALPDDLQELVLNPTGSMLDESEVPASLRREIFSLASGLRCQEFLIETRADAISPEKLRELKDSLHIERITIEIGVECTDNWILRNCVNKNMSLSDVVSAVGMIHQAGLETCANIGIGIPFLSERASIALAIRSLREAFEIGFDAAVLFPYHVKPGTVSAWLWERGLYQCCSLWAIPKILSAFSSEECKKIQISWYRNYYTDKKKILSSPHACPSCEERVLELLDEYRNHQNREIISLLSHYPCACKERWEAALQRQSPSVDFNQVAKTYHLMAEAAQIGDELLQKELAYMRQTLGGDI